MTEEKNTGAPEQEMDLSEQRLIRRAKLKELQDAGEDPFQITKYVVTARSADVKEKFEEMEGKQVSVAGRIMSKRGMGKAVFCDLQDGKGRIQLYVRIDELGEEAFAKFKKTDIGDIVGVQDQARRDLRKGPQGHSPVQVPHPPAGEVPRAEGHGDPVPPAVCGPHHE